MDSVSKHFALVAVLSLLMANGSSARAQLSVPRDTVQPEAVALLKRTEATYAKLKSLSFTARITRVVSPPDTRGQGPTKDDEERIVVYYRAPVHLRLERFAPYIANKDTAFRNGVAPAFSEIQTTCVVVQESSLYIARFNDQNVRRKATSVLREARPTLTNGFGALRADFRGLLPESLLSGQSHLPFWRDFLKSLTLEETADAGFDKKLVQDVRAVFSGYGTNASESHVVRLTIGRRDGLLYQVTTTGKNRGSQSEFYKLRYENIKPDVVLEDSLFDEPPPIRNRASPPLFDWKAWKARQKR